VAAEHLGVECRSRDDFDHLACVVRDDYAVGIGFFPIIVGDIVSDKRKALHILGGIYVVALTEVRLAGDNAGVIDGIVDFSSVLEVDGIGHPFLQYGDGSRFMRHRIRFYRVMDFGSARCAGSHRQERER
jgi:hypothetical protein